MPIGDTQAQTYVTDELIRRSLGRNAMRQSSDALAATSGKDIKNKLLNWSYTKTPFIRMVSNAVPNEAPEKCTLEWEEARRVYGEEPHAATRFEHVMWGGLGKFNESTQAVELRNTFEEKYSNPFGPYSQLQQERKHKPMPGIMSIDVNYSGNKGALRKATIQWKCYTIEDLERLEKLYMQPGIKVLLEWGWSQNTAGVDFDSNDVDLIPLDDSVLKDVSQVHIAISANRLNSGACYDGMFGTTTNFNWSVNSDLSFNCTTKITDIGDSIFTSTVNTPVVNKGTSEDDATKMTLTKALKDIKKEVEVKKRKRNIVAVETVAFEDSLGAFDITCFRTAHGSTSKLGSDSHRTKSRHRCYVRFGDIVDVLLNRLYIITSDSTRANATGLKSAHAMFAIGGNMTGGELKNLDVKGNDKKVTELPISIITNHKHLLSVDPDVCLLPGQIGAGEYDVAKALEDATYDADDMPTGIDGKPEIAFNLNQAQFDVINEPSSDSEGEADRGGWVEGDFTSGLLCNVFVNIDMLQQKSEQAQNVGDFLRTVTTSINEACGNVWAFNWTMTDEHPGVMTCVDRNFSWTGETIAVELPVANNSGIVKSLSMKSSLNQNTAKGIFMATNSQITDGKQKAAIANRAIVPIDVDFSMDGISGVQMGTSFAIDYLPAKYRSQTYLFAFTVNHSVDAGKWETNITCKPRFATTKDGLSLIQLSAIPTTEVSSTDIADLRGMLLSDAPAVGEGGEIASQNSENSGMFPRGIFRSLESENLTIGASGGDVDQGQSSAEVDEQALKFDELKEKLEKFMAKIYHKGTSEDTDNVRDAYSTLQNIIYLPEDN